MKSKIKNLGMLALTMGIITSTSLVYGNKMEVNASSIADNTKIENVSMSGRDIHKFDNTTDMMYYNTFGENFELIKHHSNQVNKTEYYDGIRMEVLSTVTITGEDSTIHTSYTFFTLQDVENRNRITNTMLLSVSDNFTEDNSFTVWGTASPILFDEETQTITFVAIYDHFSVEASNYLEHVPIKILNIFDNYTTDKIVIDDINIIDLLSSHNASFINKITGFESYSIHQLEEFDLEINDLVEGYKIKNDELSIQIDGWNSTYISNVALINNMLYLQVNTPDRFNSRDWYSLELIDTRTDNVINPIYGADNIITQIRSLDSDNMDGKMYRDFIYLIEDIDDLQYYSFYLTKDYYDTNIDTNLEVSFLSPILIDSYITGEETEILIDNQKVNIIDLKAYITKINFTIDEIEVLADETGALPEDIYVSSEFIRDNLDVTLIYNNGLEQVYLTDNIGVNWGYEVDGNIIRNLNIGMIGDVIDIHNLVAININGSIISV